MCGAKLPVEVLPHPTQSGIIVVAGPNPHFAASMHWSVDEAYALINRMQDALRVVREREALRDVGTGT